MRSGALALASDADRDRSARLLHGAYADGRIDLEDLERRLDRVHAARTRLELSMTLYGIPRRRLQRFGAAVDRADRLALKAHGTSVVVLNGSLVGVWELTGGGSFWPALALVPTGALLAWHGASSWTVRRLVRRRLGPSARA
jgi:hypothetical protein